MQTNKLCVQFEAIASLQMVLNKHKSAQYKFVILRLHFCVLKNLHEWLQKWNLHNLIYFMAGDSYKLLIM